MDAEAKAARDVALGRLDGHQGRVDLEEDVVERRAKVGAVNAGVPRRLWVVYVLAPCAVELDRLRAGYVAHAHRQQRVRAAVDAGAFAKVALFVFFQLYFPPVVVSSENITVINMSILNCTDEEKQNKQNIETGQAEIERHQEN